MSEEHPEIIMSPLCQSVTEADYSVRVEIYRGDASKWILEVADPGGGSTVWDEQFETDQLALAEFKRTLKSEGIRAFEFK